jgi:hypothetical protein
VWIKKSQRNKKVVLWCWDGCGNACSTDDGNTGKNTDRKNKRLNISCLKINKCYVKEQLNLSRFLFYLFARLFNSHSHVVCTLNKTTPKHLSRWQKGKGVTRNVTRVWKNIIVFSYRLWHFFRGAPHNVTYIDMRVSDIYATPDNVGHLHVHA